MPGESPTIIVSRGRRDVRAPPLSYYLEQEVLSPGHFLLPQHCFSPEQHFSLQHFLSLGLLAAAVLLSEEAPLLASIGAQATAMNDAKVTAPKVENIFFIQTSI